MILKKMYRNAQMMFNFLGRIFLFLCFWLCALFLFKPIYFMKWFLMMLFSALFFSSVIWIVFKQSKMCVFFKRHCKSYVIEVTLIPFYYFFLQKIYFKRVNVFINFFFIKAYYILYSEQLYKKQCLNLIKNL